MGTDSARATPVPRPHSAMGSARGGGGDGGGVKVVVRTRPANQFELKEDGNKVCFTVATEETCMLEVQGKTDPYTFTFDNVFGQHSRQIEVFEAAGIPTVDNVLSGFNSTIFAYGQTGAGKTHTMLGVIKSEEMRGLTPRVFEYLFKRIAEEQAKTSPPPEYKVVCSNLEIYNETITDLLTPGSSNLPLRNDTKMGSGTYVDGLKEVQIKSTEDALELMEIGTNSRTVSATNANLTSSRSHCVFTCVITRKHKKEDGSETTRVSRLNLVDLAGSERAKVSDGKDAQTLKEGCNINKSLTCLGRVIKELVDAQRKGGKVHVPYRDSKLTALLQESLGGNARTTIIAGVSPMYSASGESLSTLQFVQRAKHIKNKAKANENIKMDAQALHIEVLKLRSQIEKMKKEGFSSAGIESSDSGSGSGSGSPDPEAMEKLQQAQDRCQELEDQLNEAQMDKENSQMENRKLESEIGVLRNLKAELQSNINDMMDQFHGWQQKITEAEEITKKVFDAEREAIMGEIEMHKKTIAVREAEKEERDVRIGELEGDLSKFRADLEAMKASNEEIAQQLDVANNNLDKKNLEIDQLNKDYSSVSASLKESEASCAELDRKLSEAHTMIKDKTTELQSVQAELERAQTRISDVETDNAELRKKIDELENNKAELKKKIAETEMTVQQLEREKRDLQSEIELVESQRTELEEKVAYYVELSKKQREEANTLKSDFEKATVDFNEKLESKEDELKRAHVNFEAQIKARDARLAEVAKQFDEEKQRLLEAHQEKVEELQSSIEDLTAERDRKVRQHKEELKEWENKYKSSIEVYEDQLEQKEKRHAAEFEELQAAIRKKENELRDTTGRLNAEIASLQHRIQEESAKFDAEAQERERSVQEVLYRHKKEAKNQLRVLEDSVAECKATIEDKDSTIEYLKRKQADLMQASEAKLKKETTKLRHEIQETKTELESIAHASEAQLDGLERELEENKKQFANEIRYRDQRINILQQQLGEKDEHLQQIEDYNWQMLRTNQLNDTLFSVLQNINSALASVDHSRPPSAASSFNSIDERNMYDYDVMHMNSGYPRMQSSFRCPNGTDSAYQPSDYQRELQAFNVSA